MKRSKTGILSTEYLPQMKMQQVIFVRWICGRNYLSTIKLEYGENAS